MFNDYVESGYVEDGYVATPTIFYVIYAAAGADPSAAQIKLGHDATGAAAIASGSEAARTTTGTQTFATPASGLAASTSYKLAFVWSNGVTDSAVSVSAAWSTLAEEISLSAEDLAAIAAAVWAEPTAVAAHAKLDAILAKLTC